MTATLGSQLAGVVALLAVSAAPVPLLIYLTSSAGPRARIPLSPTDRILAALVLWAVVQGSVVVLLGWLGRLRFVNILFLEVVVLACGLASCARAGSWRSLASVAEPAGTEIYMLTNQAPAALNFVPRQMNFVVRSPLTADALAQSYRQTVASLDPALPVVRMPSLRAE